MDVSWLSALSAACLLVLTAAFSCQMLFDHRSVQAAREFKQKARTRHGKQHSITLFIDLRRRAETITPLLDHLEQQNYPQLTVLVVVRHTAGTRAKRQLEQYRTMHNLHLRIIRHRKGLTTANILSRYSQSDLVLFLRSGDRVSERFFHTASTHMRDRTLGATRVRRQHTLDSSLTSALIATATVWLSALQTRRYTHSNQSNYNTVYRRRLLLISSPKITTTYVTNISVSSPIAIDIQSFSARAQSIAMHPLLLTLSGVLALVALLSIAIDRYDITILGVIIFVSYATLLVLQLQELKIYTILGRVNLILLSPFSLMALSALTVYCQVYVLSRAISRNLTMPQLQKLPTLLKSNR